MSEQLKHALATIRYLIEDRGDSCIEAFEAVDLADLRTAADGQKLANQIELILKLTGEIQQQAGIK